MPATVTFIILGLWAISGLYNIFHSAHMSAAEHRAEGAALLKAAAVDRKSKRASGSYASAQAHFEIADELDRRA